MLPANDARPLIHWAVRGNHPSVAALLLANGVKLDCEHPHDGALLHLAAAHGNAELVEDLISAGANVNQPNSLRSSSKSIVQPLVATWLPGDC